LSDPNTSPVRHSLWIRISGGPPVGLADHQGDVLARIFGCAEGNDLTGDLVGGGKLRPRRDAQPRSLPEREHLVGAETDGRIGRFPNEQRRQQPRQPREPQRRLAGSARRGRQGGERPFQRPREVKRRVGDAYRLGQIHPRRALY
jgi:hypothetical protein